MKTKAKNQPLVTLTDEELDQAAGAGWAGDFAKWSTGTTDATWGGYALGKTADIAAGTVGALYAATPLGFAYNLASGGYDVANALTDPSKTWADVGVATTFAVAGLVPGFKAAQEVGEQFGVSVAKAVAGGAPTYLDDVARAAAPTLQEAFKEAVRQEVITGVVEKAGQMGPTEVPIANAVESSGYTGQEANAPAAEPPSANAVESYGYTGQEANAPAAEPPSANAVESYGYTGQEANAPAAEPPSASAVESYGYTGQESNNGSGSTTGGNDAGYTGGGYDGGGGSGGNDGGYTGGGYDGGGSSGGGSSGGGYDAGGGGGGGGGGGYDGGGGGGAF